MDFKEFKQQILSKAKEQEACSGEYKKAYVSETFTELFKVIADNFFWCTANNVMTKELMVKVGLNICNEHEFYLNESKSSGFIIADSATVEAWGSAKVRAWGSVYICAYNINIEHKISDKSILRYIIENKVLLADKHHYKTKI